MDPAKLNEEILKSIFKRIGHVSDKTLSMKQLRVGFEHTDADSFFDAVAELISEGLLLDLGQGFISLSPDGWKKAQQMLGPAAPVRQKLPTASPTSGQTAKTPFPAFPKFNPALSTPKPASGSATKTPFPTFLKPNPPRQTGKAKTAPTPPDPLTENLTWLIELLAPNLPELKLPPEEHQKALEHLANLKRLMAGTPNPVLVKAVSASLKNLTEGPISQHLSSGAQPAIWGAVLALFSQLL